MNNLTEFLSRDDIQELLSEERLDEVYENWYGDKNTLTKFFIQNGINPLEYIDRIVPDMFENMDLKHIVIPDGVTSIGDNAFDGCNNLVVTCKINSYTHNYCEENGIKYKAI